MGKVWRHKPVSDFILLLIHYCQRYHLLSLRIIQQQFVWNVEKKT